MQLLLLNQSFCTPVPRAVWFWPSEAETPPTPHGLRGPSGRLQHPAKTAGAHPRLCLFKVAMPPAHLWFVLSFQLDLRPRGSVGS